MRGSPLVRALLAFLLIAALGWPLWQLTRSPAVAAVPVGVPSATGSKAISLHLTFTTAPKSVNVRHLDQEVWKAAPLALEMEQEITLPFPEEGVDLQFHIEWADDVPQAALRVCLTDPAGDVHEKSVWGKGMVDEVLTFP
jgi:hypothetical protein